MFHFDKYLFRFIATLAAIPFAELLAAIPSLDILTTWVKFLLELILLFSALLQLKNLLSDRKKAKPTSQPD